MDVLTQFNLGKLWDFKGGIHPPERKSQSNHVPIRHAKLVEKYYIPVKQHAGKAGDILVNIGDYVLKGQPLTQGDGLRILPVHAPTSGYIINIAPYVAAHPSGLPELCIHLESDGTEQWIERNPIDDFLTQTPEQLVDKIYKAGVAGLGGAAFPTAAKIHSADKQVKLLIINGAECEPYITCDDRLMRDYPEDIIEGIRILRYILRPEKVVIAVEDNKPEAVEALQKALQGANDIEIRVIPTKYPSGAAKQLIHILTGMEVPSGQRSSSIGVLMQNVGTAFAIKRAVMNDEPLIERVVTLTGDKVANKGNQWVRIGTPIYQLLQQYGYQYDSRFPVFMGGPLMGFILPDLQAPVTKITNCLLAPDHFEYAPPAPEQSCIRCSACSDACPVNLMPQQLYWFARSEDHEKSEEYALHDCIECGLCAYVCPSHIPLIQYFRQEKAKIWDIKEKAKQAEEAKQRFEARQARLEKEEQERKARAQKAMVARREEMKTQDGVDPVQAALERLKAKKTETEASLTPVKTIIGEKGEILPDNSDIMAQRKARRLARQQEAGETAKLAENNEAQNNIDPKKAAVAAALARAKAKKAQQAGTTDEPVIDKSATQSAVENTEVSTAQPTEENDPRKAAIAAAIARAKAKKAQQAGTTDEHAIDKSATQSAVENSPISDDQATEANDPRKAAIAAAIARAKAKKAQLASEVISGVSENPNKSAVENLEIPIAHTVEENDPRKAAVAAAIARAKAKKVAAQQAKNNE
ncbi:electron transport complex subunit RsxC [Pasteurella dagmatis]|uniref:Ion-translocating oxidoreductase complex subunit C n=1 Tax=Pasteurella dagmatis ATCC 43325 TaxID=667128 RepID=C9PQK7_9PAST|nr:electron transport complex subunit RsxC [Pasteurella dagmatis]EEX50129.1 electron transport complex, RnfABCDGE type, C subunit [Pasteurella dagmatis ATCC 43325]SNV57675.1 electron transport complex protein RnfC [Pasteurella dagmatis]